MDFGDFLTSLLSRIGRGEARVQFGIAPVNLGGVHLYRFDNLTVVMPPPRAGREESPGAATVVAEPAAQPAAGAVVESRRGSSTPPRTGAAAPYRLEPLLVFNVPQSDDGLSEFEIAPRTRTAVVRAPEADVTLSQFDAAQNSRHVRIEDGMPVRIRRDTAREWVEFNSRRQARLGTNELWSRRKFPAGKPVRLAATGPGQGLGSIAVSVDRNVWATSWLLTRKDPQRWVRDSSFLILVGL